MSEHTCKFQTDQEKRQQSEVVADLCYRFVRPLLKNLYRKLDRRLVQTLLDLLMVIVIHRHRNHGLLLGELGGIYWVALCSPLLIVLLAKIFERIIA